MTQTDDPKTPRLLHFAFTAAWLIGACLCWNGESTRLKNAPADQPTWVSVVTNLNPDTTLFVPLLIAAPVIWFLGTKKTRAGETSTGASATRSLLVSTIVGIAAFGVSQHVAQQEVANSGFSFGELPPAYHDEFSYLFQARTFLAQKTAFPTQGSPGLFDQMHVLNDRGSFASRYFPSTGLWMMPSVAAGQPWLGHRTANGLIAALFCFAACRMSGLRSGLVTGALITIAPGMAIFSNMLLAHHPTLVGLGVFTVAFFEARTNNAKLWGPTAGLGLTFAMLARPMSAAGFALPFGICLVWHLLRNQSVRSQNITLAITIGVPILCGFATLAAYNHSITGDALTTPYSLYTNLYTPNHVYGFDNVKRGDKVEAPKRIAKYDGWAENLTRSTALRNCKRRLSTSFQWTLGLIPNAMLAVFAILFWPRLRPESRIVLASIASIHLAHIPYWFEGIMGFHYVFEASVLWCLLASLLAADVRATIGGRRAITVLSACCIVTATLGTWFNPPNPMVQESNLFATTRIQSELDGIAFSKLRIKRFQDEIQKIPKPALVLVKHDDADIHIEYVSNRPQLNDEVLTGHLGAFDPKAPENEPLLARNIFVFDAKAGTLVPFQTE